MAGVPASKAFELLMQCLENDSQDENDTDPD